MRITAPGPTRILGGVASRPHFARLYSICSGRNFAAARLEFELPDYLDGLAVFGGAGFHPAEPIAGFDARERRGALAAGAPRQPDLAARAEPFTGGERVPPAGALGPLRRYSDSRAWLIGLGIRRRLPVEEPSVRTRRRSPHARCRAGASPGTPALCEF